MPIIISYYTALVFEEADKDTHASDEVFSLSFFLLRRGATRGPRAVIQLLGHSPLLKSRNYTGYCKRSLTQAQVVVRSIRTRPTHVSNTRDLSQSNRLPALYGAASQKGPKKTFYCRNVTVCIRFQFFAVRDSY